MQCPAGKLTGDQLTGRVWAVSLLGLDMSGQGEMVCGNKLNIVCSSASQ